MARIQIKGREDGGTQDYDIDLNLRDEGLELIVDGKSIAKLLKVLERLSSCQRDIGEVVSNLNDAVFVLEDLYDLLRE